MLEPVWYTQPLPHHGLADPLGTLAAALDSAPWPPVAGRRIAVAVGSRGIHGLPGLVRAVVEAIRARGGEPFIVPAMGSHGAATAEGQAQVLARLGVAPENVGAPVRATMATVCLGTTASGVPVYLDREAAGAGGLILLNRVKVHTSFHGRHESGVLKQLAIGLGNHDGAAAVHRPGVGRLAATIEEVGRFALAHAPVILGVAVVEDGYDEPAAIEVLTPEGILEREPLLLDRARELLPRLPFDDLDVLVVEALGKDISGTGMDPNVIGRRAIRGEADYDTPRIRVLVVLDLTAATGGNGLGIGFADLTTQRVLDKLDPASMAANALTTGLLERAKIPLACTDEAVAIATALDLIRDKPPEAVRLARIANTRDLARIGISPALVEEALAKGLRPA